MVFQDFPGPGILKKKIQDFPGGVGTLLLATVTAIAREETASSAPQYRPSYKEC